MKIKSLFVLGDSISMHYGPYLEMMLAGVCNYSRKGYGGEEGDLDYGSTMNGGDSHDCHWYLGTLTEEQWSFDTLLLNCGLHDVKTENGIRQRSEEEYEKYLRQIVAMVKARGKNLIFVTSTPVDDEIHNSRNEWFQRYNRDLIAYNKIAVDIMEEAGVPVIDLYSFTKKAMGAIDGEVYADHIHFVDDMRRMHAAYIAGCITDLNTHTNFVNIM